MFPLFRIDATISLSLRIKRISQAPNVLLQTSDEKESRVADRTLLVLLFFVERIEENSITNEYLDQELNGTDIHASTLIQVCFIFQFTI
jgi:hypothetical protein